MPLFPRRLFSTTPRRERTGRARRRALHVARPPGMSAREYEAYQLYALAEAGVTMIRLRAPRGPDTPTVCAETDGFVMTVDEAMLLRPIPHEVGDGGVCNCAYRPAGAR